MFVQPPDRVLIMFVQPLSFADLWSWSCRSIDYAFFDTRDMPPSR